MNKDIKTLDMEVQVQHSGKGSDTCTTSGKDSDCCWHDCLETRKTYSNGQAWIFTLSTCKSYTVSYWATYSTSAFS